MTDEQPTTEERYEIPPPPGVCGRCLRTRLIPFPGQLPQMMVHCEHGLGAFAVWASGATRWHIETPISRDDASERMRDLILPMYDSAVADAKSEEAEKAARARAELEVIRQWMVEVSKVFEFRVGGHA